MFTLLSLMFCWGKWEHEGPGSFDDGPDAAGQIVVIEFFTFSTVSFNQFMFFWFVNDDVIKAIYETCSH